MPQVLRDNAGDTRVVEDVAALAAAYDDAAIATAAEAARQARQDDLALLSELFARQDPPTEPWWQRAAHHVKRHRTYYAVGVVVLAVLLFRSPEPLPLAGSDDEASHLIPTGDTQIDDTPAPATDVQFDSPAYVLPTIDDLGDLDAFSTISPPPTDPSPPAPAILRFTQSGYASSLGGTPVEQEPPANGLPVEAIAGQVTRYSYVRLAGGGSGLRLKALTQDGAAINAGQAQVQLCHITTKGWQPSRGAPTSDAPKYNGACIAGTNKGGVWSFAFSSKHNPLDPNGWAIVPVLDGNVTFRVTFASTAA